MPQTPFFDTELDLQARPFRLGMFGFFCDGFASSQMLLENTLFFLIGLKNVEKSVLNVGVVFLHQGTQISSFRSPVRDFSDVSWL